MNKVPGQWLDVYPPLDQAFDRQQLQLQQLLQLLALDSKIQISNQSGTTIIQASELKTTGLKNKIIKRGQR